MAIEFRCSACEKLLRVVDASAGKKCKCPSCAAVLDIPVTSVPAGTPPNPFADPSPSSTMPASSAQTLNPYQSPASIADENALKFVVRDSLIHSKIEIGDLFGRTWSIFSAEMGTAVLFALLVIAISVAALLVNGPLALVAENVKGQPASALVVRLALIAWELLVQSLLSCVSILFVLNLARRKPSPFDGVFAIGKHYLPVLGQSTIMATIWGGFNVIRVYPEIILAIIEQPPSIIVAIGVGCLVYAALATYLFVVFLLAPFFIIDRKLGVIASMKASAAYMRSNKLVVAVTVLVTMILGTLFSVFTCFIGFLFYMPYFMLMEAVIYLLATGQFHGAHFHGAHSRIAAPPQ
jgi:phage FluMu protein Com